MKRLRNSVKAIIIAAVLAVVAIATVVTVVLVNKNKSNPGGGGGSLPPQYALTAAQKDLGNAINAQGLKDAETPEFSAFDSSMFVDENGYAVDVSQIERYSANRFSVYDGKDDFFSYVRLFFVKKNGSVYNNIELVSHLMSKNLIDSKYTFAKCVDYNDNFAVVFCLYEIESVKKGDLLLVSISDANNISVVKKIESVDNWKGFLFDLKDEYLFAMSMIKDDINNTTEFLFNVTRYDNLNEASERIFLNNNGSEHFYHDEFGIVVEQQNYAKFIYLSEDEVKSFNFEKDANYSYEFDTLKTGVWISKQNNSTSKLSYQYFSASTGKLNDVIFEDEYNFYTVDSIDKYFYIIQKNTTENSFKFDYYNDCFEKIISYNSNKEDDYIAYLDGESLLTKTKVISSYSSVDAVDKLNLKKDDYEYNISNQEFCPGEFFVVSGNGYNVAKINGTIIFDEFFESIYQSKDGFIGVVEEQYYVLNTTTYTADPIDDFSELSLQNFAGKTLIDYGYYVTESDGYLSLFTFDGQKVSILDGSNHVTSFDSITITNDAGCGFVFANVDYLSTKTSILFLFESDLFSSEKSVPQPVANPYALVNENVEAYASKEETFTGNYPSKVTFKITFYAIFSFEYYVNLTRSGYSITISSKSDNCIKGFSHDSSASVSVNNGVTSVTCTSSTGKYLFMTDTNPSISYSSKGSTTDLKYYISYRATTTDYKNDKPSYYQTGYVTVYKSTAASTAFNNPSSATYNINGATYKGGYTDMYWSTQSSWFSSTSAKNLTSTTPSDYLDNGNIEKTAYRYACYKENEYTFVFDAKTPYDSAGKDKTTTAGPFYKIKDTDAYKNMQLAGSKAATSYKKEYTWNYRKSISSSEIPTVKMDGFTHTGWHISGKSTKISGSTYVYAYLTSSQKKWAADSSGTTDEKTVTFIAWWEPLDYTVNLNWASNISTTANSGDGSGDVYVKVGISLIEGETNKYTGYDPENSGLWTFTRNGNIITPVSSDAGETGSIDSTKKFVMFTDNGKNYILVKRNINLEIKSGVDEFIVKNTSTNITYSRSSLDDVTKFYLSGDKKFEFTYTPNNKVVDYFKYSNYTGTNKPVTNLISYLNASNMTVSGATGYEFVGWAIRGDESGASDKVFDVNYYTDVTLEQYRKAHDAKNDTTPNNQENAIRLYAIYETRDYNISTSKNEVEGSLKNEQTASFKNYQTYIANTKQTSVTTISGYTDIKYKGGAEITVTLNGVTTDTYTDVNAYTPYYVFDRIELQNFGYRYYSGGVWNYSYGRMIFKFEYESGNVSIAVSFIPNGQNTTIAIGNGPNQLHTEPGVGKYWVSDGDGSDIFNKIQIEITDKSLFKFRITNCGVPGSIDEESGDFYVSEETSRSGLTGFTVAPYPKSNFLEHDSITSANKNGGSGEIESYSIAKLNESIVYINNIKYTLNSTDIGFYLLKADGSAEKDVAATSVDSTHVYCDGTYIYYNDNTISSGSINNYFNYGNTRLIAVKPAQTIKILSNNPNNSSSSSVYELNSYLSKITIAGYIYNLGIVRDISDGAESNIWNYENLQLSIVFGNGTSGNPDVHHSSINDGPAANVFTAISYCGSSYSVLSYTSFTIPGSETAFNRTLHIYLARHTSNNEIIYFVYSSVFGISMGTENNLGIEFEFTEFDKELAINVSFEDGDKYDTSDNTLLYRYAFNGTNYNNTGLEAKTGTTLSTATFNSANYIKNTSATFLYSPNEFILLELQPTDGYLIQEIKLQLNSTEMFKLVLNQMNFGHDKNVNGYTYADEDTTSTKIFYTATGGYFNVYQNLGINISAKLDKSWWNFSSLSYDMNPIYILINGTYQDIEIDVKTISYSEILLNADEGGLNLGFNAASANRLPATGYIFNKQTTQYSMQALEYVSVLLHDGMNWFKVGSGAKGDEKDAIVANVGDGYFRIIFLGKAKFFKQGVKLYASGLNYSSYFTNGRLYYDANASGNGFNKSHILEYNGRQAEGAALGNESLRQTDLLTYMFISWRALHNTKTDVGSMTTFGEGTFQFEFSRKYVFVADVEQNTSTVTMNSYIYNKTLSSGTAPTESTSQTLYTGSESGTEWNSDDSKIKYYYDSSSDRFLQWKYMGSAWSCYQLDYVGYLGSNSSEKGDYRTKTASWFNDTMLTNINASYNIYQTGSSAGYALTANWQDINYYESQSYQTAVGYGISCKYYEIPGYYLQYIEIETNDYGRIMIDVLKNSDGKILIDGYTGIYLEITYVQESDPIEGYYQIYLYQTSDVLEAAIDSIGLISNNFAVNFYSQSYSYVIQYDKNTGNASTGDEVVYGNSNGEITEQAIIDSYTTTVSYDSLTYLDFYMTMPGYTFVGWASESFDTDGTSRYMYDHDSYSWTWNSSSSWVPMTSYFDPSKRNDLLGLAGNTYGYDFYVKSSASDNAKTGYFITDTGYANTTAYLENYNFWSAYASTFVGTIGNRKPSTIITFNLYGVWKANVYALEFNVNDTTYTNGSTEAKLQVGKSTTSDFNDRLLSNTLKAAFKYNEDATNTYYCYVTFDKNDWFITNDKFARNYDGDGSNHNLLDIIVDRYGYSWLGWFTSRKANSYQLDSVETSNLLQASSYYTDGRQLAGRGGVLPYFGRSYTIGAGGETTYDLNAKLFNPSAGTIPDDQRSTELNCIDFSWFETLFEPYSKFDYVGHERLLKLLDNSYDLSSAYVAFYNYKNSASATTAVSGTKADSDDLNGYTARDFLNEYDSGSSYRHISGTSAYLTFFDTSLPYDSYLVTVDNSTLKLEIKREISQRYITLYAFWDTNLYVFNIDYRADGVDGDDNPVEYDSISKLGSSYINKSSEQPQFSFYFDDEDLSDKLNNFNPTRIGYDFLGWSFLFNTSVTGTTSQNIPTTMIATDNNGGTYETSYFLNNTMVNSFSILDSFNNRTSIIPLFTSGILLNECQNSYQMLNYQETYGDTELMSHYAYIFAIWQAQTFTINVNLNIQAEDLENLYETDSNFVIALYNSADYNRAVGINSNFYRYNNQYYSEIAANVTFVVTFDGSFKDAYLKINTNTGVERFYLKDLFATSTGYYLLGWMKHSTDLETYFIRNTLMSALGKTDNEIANLVDGASNYAYANGTFITTDDAALIFDFNAFKTLYNTNYKPGFNAANNLYNSELFNSDNVVALKDIDKAGASSNFGYVDIDSVKHYIQVEIINISGVDTAYLYFKYEGLKYYVQFYYLETTTRIVLKNDESYLYYEDNEGVKYIVRFDTNGDPYVLTNYYIVDSQKVNSSYLTRINLKENIRIAIYTDKSKIENWSPTSTYNRLEGSGPVFTLNVINGNETNKKSISFVPLTTRQFTLYAHWQNKNNLVVDINNQNNIGVSSSSNNGLAGYYEIENSGGNHDLDVESSQSHGGFVSSTEVFTDVNGEDDEGLESVFNYYDDLYIGVVPFFNGRYLSEMTLTFYGAEENKLSATDDASLLKSNYKLQTYRIYMKFAWNSQTRKTVLVQLSYAVGSGEYTTLETVQTTDESGGFVDITNDNISKFSLLDSQSFANVYGTTNSFVRIYDYLLTASEFANSNNTYGRWDTNKLSLQMRNVMTDIKIDCKFSVQTYEVGFYSILYNGESEFEGVDGDTNKYLTPLQRKDINHESLNNSNPAYISSQKHGESSLATIPTDCAKYENTTPGVTYNVPYGYFIYGQHYNSPFKPNRPIDETGDALLNLKDIGSEDGLLAERLYGFAYIYSEGYYDYGSKIGTKIKQSSTDDPFSAQCSGALGEISVFNEARGVRLSGLSFFVFDAWYELDELLTGDDDEARVVFDAYTKQDESTYINRNITLYGYYYTKNEPTSIQFYTWDEGESKYVGYNGNVDQYTLNGESESTYYESKGGFLKLKDNIEADHIDADNIVKIRMYNTFGVDKKAFSNAEYTSKDFDSAEYSPDRAVLDKVLDTYWYYLDSYTKLYFDGTTGHENGVSDYVGQRHYIRYDKESTNELGKFYFLTDEGDSNSAKIYVKIATTDMVSYTISQASNSAYEGLHIKITDVQYTTSKYGTEYNFKGADLYLKTPTSAGEYRYYKLYEVDKSIFTEEATSAWLKKQKPRFYIECEGQKFYMMQSAGDDLYSASTFTDENGNTSFEPGSAGSRVQVGSLVALQNYYVNADGYYFKINYYQAYDTVTDTETGMPENASLYYNPIDYPRENKVSVYISGRGYVDCYFNYTTKTLYEDINARVSNVEEEDLYTLYYIQLDGVEHSRYFPVKKVADDSYYNGFDETHWVRINKPKYFVEYRNQRYFINEDTLAPNASQTLYSLICDENGNPFTTVERLVTFDSYEVVYDGVIYPVQMLKRYEVGYSDDKYYYYNPFVDATTNTVRIKIADNIYRDCYFDYVAQMLFAELEASFDNYIYSAINENYSINANYDNSRSIWSIADITIKSLPNPNIGFWYNGERFNYVGYIELTQKIFDELKKKSTTPESKDGGAIYMKFMDHIDLIYTEAAFDVSRFENEDLYNAFISNYSDGTGLLSEAVKNFVVALKSAVEIKLGSPFTIATMLSTLLVADSYIYDDVQPNVIKYINVNIPVKLEDLIADPRREDAKQISISTVTTHQFDILSTSTVVDEKIHAVPIYHPYVMDFTNSSVSTSGKVVTVNTEKMNVSHFETTATTAHIYNKKNGDLLNFVILDYDQYLDLSDNSFNIAEYLSMMVKTGIDNPSDPTKWQYKDKFVETQYSSLIEADLSAYEEGHYVMLAYYNKTGIANEEDSYIIRVSDNMIHFEIQNGVSDVSYEIVKTLGFEVEE